MSIDYLFDAAEQKQIRTEISTLKARYEAENVHPKGRHYFTKLASHYKLYQRVKEELCDHKKGKILAEELTDDGKIAELFGVHRITITKYLKREFDQRDYKQRSSLCRSEGSRRGGKNGNKTTDFKGNRHLKKTS